MLIEQITVTDEIYAEAGLAYANQYGYEDMATFENDFTKEQVYEVILYDLVVEHIIRNAIITDAE